MTNMSGESGAAILIEFEGIDKMITGISAKSTWSDLTYALLTKRYNEARRTSGRDCSNVPMTTPLEALCNYAVFERFGERRQLSSRCRVLKVGVLIWSLGSNIILVIIIYTNIIIIYIFYIY